ELRNSRRRTTGFRPIAASATPPWPWRAWQKRTSIATGQSANRSRCCGDGARGDRSDLSRTASSAAFQRRGGSRGWTSRIRQELVVQAAQYQSTFERSPSFHVVRRSSGTALSRFGIFQSALDVESAVDRAASYELCGRD